MADIDIDQPALNALSLQAFHRGSHRGSGLPGSNDKDPAITVQTVPLAVQGERFAFQFQVRDNRASGIGCFQSRSEHGEGMLTKFSHVRRLGV
jgi:hypothetical protein